MRRTYKDILSSIIPSPIWNYLRERSIVRRHGEVAALCKELIEQYYNSDCCEVSLPLKQKKELGDRPVIWQYWGQGFEESPELIKQCKESVNRWAKGFEVIRLDDDNIGDYIDLPSFILDKKDRMTRAHFSDILRVCLLCTYGGLWLDSSIFLSGPIPDYVTEGDFFAYQRDPNEPNKDYWKRVYAYYFGWKEGFRVNMLNSVLYAKKGSSLIIALCTFLLFFWTNYDSVPDYFFFQILFDVLITDRFRESNCPIVGDCKPHYLQQYYHDKDFYLASYDDIIAHIPIHKLSYK